MLEFTRWMSDADPCSSVSIWLGLRSHIARLSPFGRLRFFLIPFPDSGYWRFFSRHYALLGESSAPFDENPT